MWKYRRLPSDTPDWVTLAILLMGGCLGLAISAEALLALYGICGFIVSLFYPLAGFTIGTHEAVYLGVTGALAGWSAIWLGFVAVYMNRLSHRALAMSRLGLLPCLLTLGMVIVGRHVSSFKYGFPTIWLVASYAALILGAAAPYLLLRQQAVARVHNSHS